MQTVGEFDRAFGTDEQCRRFLVQMRWPDGVRCPRCNRKEKVYALKARRFYWACKNEDCGKRQGFRFSVISGTIFENTKKVIVLYPEPQLQCNEKQQWFDLANAERILEHDFDLPRLYRMA